MAYESVENREAAFAKRMSEWSLGVMLLIRTLGVFFQSSGGGAVMLSCFALTPHYLSHTKTDGPIRGIADYKTTRK